MKVIILIKKTFQVIDVSMQKISYIYSKKAQFICAWDRYFNLNNDCDLSIKLLMMYIDMEFLKSWYQINVETEFKQTTTYYKHLLTKEKDKYIEYMYLALRKISKCKFCSYFLLSFHYQAYTH